MTTTPPELKSANDLLRHIRDTNAKMVDLRFCNLFGGWHHPHEVAMYYGV